MLPHPIIFVPGITATALYDAYTLPPETVWSLLRKPFERLALHPHDLRYESREPALVRSQQVFEVAYEELIEELRGELSYRCGAQVPVYPFGYDWRQPLEDTQAKLRDFIDEVIERTRLMPHYRKKYKNRIKVTLVGHSMGGMLIARLLAEHEDLPIDKVASLATPFLGSFEAVVKMTVGTGKLGRGKPSHMERKAARLTPALYQLLPGFPLELETAPGEFEGMIEEPLPQTLFDAEAWQPSVVAAIKDFIIESGLGAKTPAQDASKLFRQLLDGARLNQRKLEKLDLAKHGLKETDWLAIVGVDSPTRVEIEVRHGARSAPEYKFRKQHTRNLWDDENPPFNWHETGDGTVPLMGALPPFLPREQLVLITPEDYGAWEIQDRMLSALGGFHGILPNMNLVQRLLLRFITEATDPHRNTWGRALPGIEDWQPPLKLGRAENNFSLV